MVRLASITRHLLGLYLGEPGGKAFRRVLSEQSRAEGAGWEAVEAALRRVKSEVVPLRGTAKGKEKEQNRAAGGSALYSARSEHLHPLQRTK